MQVAKCGNSLAVQVPAVVGEALGLIEIYVAAPNQFWIARMPSHAGLLRRLYAFRGRLPAALKFDRDDANARLFLRHERTRLCHLLGPRKGRVSRTAHRRRAQVLTKLANIARREMKLSWMETSSFLELFQALRRVQAATIDKHARGRAVARRCGLPVSDAMIAAAALEASSGKLWSEDMQHGPVIDDRPHTANPCRP